MPTYEYQCKTCEHRFEIWQSVGEEAPPCPECAAEVRKIFHPVRTIFKGSGFYITDSRSVGGKPSGSGDNPPAASSEKASDSNSAATPKADTAPKAEPAAAGA